MRTVLSRNKDALGRVKGDVSPVPLNSLEPIPTDDYGSNHPAGSWKDERAACLQAGMGLNHVHVDDSTGYDNHGGLC